MSEIRSQATPADGSLQTEHYQLFNLIENTISAVIESAGPEDEYWEAASAVLKAGWSKPRTVNSAAELDALPVGSVVHSAAGTIAAKLDRTEGVVFGIHRSFQWSGLALPATVLFTPGDVG